MRIENVKGIVWDLDGTLLDSFGVFEQVVADMIAERDYTTPTREFMLHNYHGTLDETLGRVFGIELAEDLEEATRHFLEKQERHYAGDLESHLYQDAARLAQAAAEQNIHQLLVTNRAHEGRGNASPRFIIAATVLAGCISEIHTGDEVQYRKPDKRSLDDWADRNHLSSEGLLVIGDQYVDGQLALNLGARALLVKRENEIPHLDQLTQQGHESIIVVDNLENVELVAGIA